jgi:putative component of membrane protein insertase Oxa1/YidC/SpoIIIJ protein YidD
LTSAHELCSISDHRDRSIRLERARGEDIGTHAYVYWIELRRACPAFLPSEFIWQFTTSHVVFFLARQAFATISGLHARACRPSSTGSVRVSKPRIVEFEGTTIECHVDDLLAPSVLRAFIGTTPMDSEVDRLLVPERPGWRRIAVLSLRWYRGQIGFHLGHRCVFEPSCSRYAELAVRQHTPWRAFSLIVGRLRRCRPGSGGADLPKPAR